MKSLKVDQELRERVMPVRLMIFDVDGVLTDGSIVFHDDGSELKVFDVHDGHGIKLLQRAGIEVAIITGRSCRAVEHRAAGLGISRVYQGIHRKLEAFERIMVEKGFEPRQLGYMGDDLIDIPVMRRVGFSVSVPNAVAHVLPFAHYVTRARGGHGACREVCEILLRVQGLWEQVTMDYFKNPD